MDDWEHYMMSDTPCYYRPATVGWESDVILRPKCIAISLSLSQY
jgi:hypothetical protein